MFAWIRKIFDHSTQRTHRRPVRPRRQTFRPAFEGLESRTVPAFLAPVSTAASVTANSLALGDFNGDGLADIVSVGNISGRGVISVSKGNGDGTFQAAKISNSGNSNPLQVRVADFDGDGHLDVVCLGSSYIDSLTVRKGNGDGTFQPPTPYTYSIPPTEIEVGDVNNDRRPDLIEGNHFFSTTGVRMNDGTGHFGPKVDSPGVIAPTTVETAE
ncbi:MAG TPA: VCBS repeat-containing protein [Gemmataceae bacterium]|nr:VCBS repeat-containing protein [Gemmataceae bacterium]